MIELASNSVVLLVKSKREYFIIMKYAALTNEKKGWRTECLNEQSKDYNAKNALKYMEEHYGKAVWLNENINVL